MLSATLAFASFCVPLRASADAADESKDAAPKLSEEKRAEALEERAALAMDKGRKAEAADLLGAAWGAYKNPRYVCNQGRLLASLARYIEAAETISTCLRVRAESDGPAMKARIELDLQNVRKHVGALGITANVPGAEILVDSKVVGTLPREGAVFLEPGRHSVEVRAPGYEPDVKMVRAAEGSWMELRMKLVPQSDAGWVAQVPMVVSGPPGSVCSAPGVGPTASPASTFSPAVGTVPGAPPPVGGQPRNYVAVITGIGIGVAGAGVGVGGLIGAIAKVREADELDDAIAAGPKETQCTALTPDPRCATAQSIRASVTPWAVVSALGFAMSGVGIALAVYEIKSSDGSPSGSSPVVVFATQPGGGTLLLTGRF